MSKNEANEMIDEQELRDALRPLSANREAFEAGVRQRIGAAQNSYSEMKLPDAQREQAREYSPWLQVAASVLPLPLVGKVVHCSTSISLGKISFGYKLIGIVALPAVSLLLMAGATLFGIQRMRSAQSSPQREHQNVVEMESAIARWWKQFGWLIGGLCALALLLMFIGYALPVYIALVTSGIAMVALVTRLGHAGMLDRQAIARNQVAGLAILAQVTLIYTMNDSGVHLLDQALIQSILYCGMAVLLMFIVSVGSSGWRAVTGFFCVAAFGVLVVGYFSRSLWSPVSVDEMKYYVETFDEAPFDSSSWQQWAVPADWLRESDVSLNLKQPRELLQREIVTGQNPFVLGIAFNSELIEPSDLPRLRDLDAKAMQLLDMSQHSRPILSVQQNEYVIRALVMLDRLDETERNLVESRLLATLREVDSVGFYELVDASVCTRLLETIDRPCADTTIRSTIHKMLLDLQRVHFHLGGRSGGFSPGRDLNHCDELATVAAVQLMQSYGVPAELDVMSLTSYLRPSINDHFMKEPAFIRAATKQRLESLPGISRLTWWDYAHYETGLWLSLMIVLLCLCATFGSPNRSDSEGV